MLTVQHKVADALHLERKSKHGLAYEDRDIHEVDAILESPLELRRTLDSVRGGASGMGRPRKWDVHIKGMGDIWDYRHFTFGNGPLMTPLLYVEHIPVIRQMAGREDLDTLWRVLVAQGLMVHNGTDGEGNVALYCQMDRVCYQARGANALSCGTEHMHLTTLDDWTDKQLNAAAFLSHRAKQHYDIPRRRGIVTAGDGVVGCSRRGHTTHQIVSAKAGYNDRSDPGQKFVDLMGEIEQRSVFFTRHRHF